MKIAFFISSDRWVVIVDGSARSFDSEEAGLEYMESLKREVAAAADSARDTYFSMKANKEPKP